RSGAGDAKECLVFIFLREAAYELRNSVGLVAGHFEIGGEAEGGVGRRGCPPAIERDQALLLWVDAEQKGLQRVGSNGRRGVRTAEGTNHRSPILPVELRDY